MTVVLDTRLRDSRRHRDKKVPQTASWVVASSLPLALLVVPLGGKALDGVHPHVQHPLHLLGLPLVIEGPGALGEDWRKNRGQEPDEHVGVTAGAPNKHAEVTLDHGLCWLTGLDFLLHFKETLVTVVVFS